MDVIDAVYHRRAVRGYTAARVDRDVIRFVIKAAVQAPSAMNLQPWSFVVVEDRAALERWSVRSKSHLLDILTPESPLAKYRDRLADPAFDILYHAPVMIVVCATSSEGQAIEDCCLAAQNLLLAAHASGLATCWIGFARPWLNTVEGKKALGIPSSYAPVAPIILGHGRGETPSHPRREPEIHWIESPSFGRTRDAPAQSRTPASARRQLLRA